MYRSIPSANKILSKKWLEREQNIQRKSLESIKGVMDMESPRYKHHTLNKLKKTKMMEVRYSEIEKHNRILLERISNIH